MSSRRLPPNCEQAECGPQPPVHGTGAHPIVLAPACRRLPLPSARFRWLRRSGLLEVSIVRLAPVPLPVLVGIGQPLGRHSSTAPRLAVLHANRFPHRMIETTPGTIDTDR